MTAAARPASPDWLAQQVDFEGLLNLAADAILLLGEDQRILFFNESAARLFGYRPEEMRGRPLDLLIPERFAPAHAAHVRAFAVGAETSRPMASRQPVWGRRKDGTEVPLEISLSQQSRAGVVVFAAVARDITERLQAYQLLEQRVEERTREIERRQQVAEGLREVLATINSNRPLDEILERLLARAGREFGAAAGAVFQLDGEGQTLVIQATHALPAAYARHAALPLSAAPWREAVAARQAVFIPNLAGLAPLPGLPDEPYTAGLAIPIFIREEMCGLLLLYFQAYCHFTPEDQHLASMIGHQAALALENARLRTQVQALAALEERQRLARELHDSVSQNLYGIALSVRTARTWLDRDPAKAAEPLDFCLGLAEAGLTEMRALIFELRPESLELEGLVAAMQKQAAAVAARHGLVVHQHLGAEPYAPLHVKEALYRLTQEALQNIVRHARATQVQLHLEVRGEELVWEISDNGRGFDPTAAFPGHWGLRSMQERVERVGGRFEIQSAPGAGTCLRAHIPAPGAGVSRPGS